MVRSFAMRCNLMIAVLWFAIVPTVCAQTGTVDLDTLGKNRVEYERSMQIIRNDVLRTLERAAQSRTEEARTAAIAERRAFLATGALPDHPKASAWRKRYNDEHATLALAFDRAVAAAETADAEDIIQQLRVERTIFDEGFDLAPWQAMTDLGAQPIAPNTPWWPDELSARPLRLEISFKDLDASDRLVVRVPVAEGRNRVFPLDHESNTAMLTLTASDASADFGINRSAIRFGDVAAGEPTPQIVLEHGDAVISGVRFKPYIVGELPRVNQFATHGKQVKPHEVRPGDQLVAGMEFVGFRVDGDKKTTRAQNVRIAERNGDEIILKMQRANGTGTAVFSIAVSPNGQLRPQGWSVVGGSPIKMSVEGGAGRFDGERLQMRVHARWDGPNRKNNRFTFKLDVQKK